ncbi:MAG: hypothetical protein ACOCQT_01845 [Desulfovermiculus sp.]
MQNGCVNSKNVEEFVEVYCDLFKKAVREGKSPHDLVPVVLNSYASWGEVGPPRLSRLMYLAFQLPPVIARKRVYEYLGGAITSKMLANADSRGVGPRVRLEMGRNICYPTLYLLEWLEDQNVAVRTA